MFLEFLICLKVERDFQGRIFCVKRLSYTMGNMINNCLIIIIIVTVISHMAKVVVAVC